MVKKDACFYRWETFRTEDRRDRRSRDNNLEPILISWHSLFSARLATIRALLNPLLIYLPRVSEATKLRNYEGASASDPKG